MFSSLTDSLEHTLFLFVILSSTPRSPLFYFVSRFLFSSLSFFSHPFAPDDTVTLVSHSPRTSDKFELMLAVRTLSWKTQVSPYTTNGNGLFIFLPFSPLSSLFTLLVCRVPLSSFFSFSFSSSPAILSTTILYN